MSWCYIHAQRARGSTGAWDSGLKCVLSSFHGITTTRSEPTSKINSQNRTKAFMSPRQPRVAWNQTVSHNHLFSLATQVELRPRNIIPSSSFPLPPLILSLSSAMCATHNRSLSNILSWPDFSYALIKQIFWYGVYREQGVIGVKGLRRALLMKLDCVLGSTEEKSKITAQPAMLSVAHMTHSLKGSV